MLPLSSLDFFIYFSKRHQYVSTDHQTNIQMLLNDLGEPVDQVFVPQQRHTDQLTILTKNATSAHPLPPDNKYSYTDGVVSNLPLTALAVYTADCVPVLIYDNVNKIVGAVHSGWKGTQAHIVNRAVSILIEQFNCKPDNINVLIGPHIGPCCYEVKKDVASQFTAEYQAVQTMGSRLYLNLKEAIIRSLRPLPLNITSLDLCTACNSADYFSFRRDGKVLGSQYAIIKIRT